MKDIELIKKDGKIKIKAEGQNGFHGAYYDMLTKKWLNFVFSYSCGFEHLSVSMPNRTPSWEQMCMMKDVFWNEDEVCMQLHPKKEEYVNNHNHCLHIWKPTTQEIPQPPSILVGIRHGHLKEDAEQLIEFCKQHNIEIDEEIKKEMKDTCSNLNL